MLRINDFSNLTLLRGVVSVGSVGSMEPTDFVNELLEPTEFEGKWDENFE